MTALADTLSFIPANPRVTPLTESSVSLLEAIQERFNTKCYVVIHETLHGHMASFTRVENALVPGAESLPLRLDKTDFQFLANQPAIRWIEATCGKVAIGFNNGEGA